MAPVDPYLQWLGIPVAEQPPNHYRLLSLPLFEENSATIEAAIQRTLRRIAPHQDEHAQLCSRLLKEIKAIQSCLLDPVLKSDYDELLRNRLDGHADGAARKTAKPAQPSAKASRSGVPKTPAAESSIDDLFDDSLPAEFDDFDPLPLENMDFEPAAETGNGMFNTNVDEDTLSLDELMGPGPAAGEDDLDALFGEPSPKPNGKKAPAKKQARPSGSKPASATEEEASAKKPTAKGRQPLQASNPDEAKEQSSRQAQKAANVADDPLLALLPESPGYDVLPLDNSANVTPSSESSITRQTKSRATTKDSEAEDRPCPRAASVKKRASKAQPVAAQAGAKKSPPRRALWIGMGLVGAGLAALVGAVGWWLMVPRIPSYGPANLISRYSQAQPLPAAAPAAPTQPPVAPSRPTKVADRPPVRPTLGAAAKPCYEVDQPMRIESAQQALAQADGWWSVGQERRGRERDFLLLRAGYWYSLACDAGANDAETARLAERQTAIASIQDPGADVEGGPWAAALNWPVAFSDSLRGANVVDKFHCFLGLSSGDVVGGEKAGLRVVGGQGATTLWLREAVSVCYELTLQFTLSDQGTVGLWLGGPGHGNSTQLGYCLLLGETRADLLRKGVLGSSVRLRPRLDRGRAHQATVLRDGNRFLVWIDGVLLICYEDPAPLAEPLHNRVGFGAVGGQRDNGVWLGDVVLRHPLIADADRSRLNAVPLSPNPTVSAAPNGEPLFSLVGPDTVGEGWYSAQPEFSLPISRDKLFLCGPSGTPLVLRRQPLEGDFAFEVAFQYVEPRFPRSQWNAKSTHQDNFLHLGGEALNFHLLAYFEPQLPSATHLERFVPDVGGGWEVALPNGEGINAVSWARGQQRQIVAQTPYYAPVPGQEYIARLERHGNVVRVFLNGALMFSAQQPGPRTESPAVIVGFRQLFGGSIVHRVAAWRIQRDPAILATKP